MNRLFEPVSIGRLQLTNRIVFAPVCTGYEENGMITPRSKTLYTTVARGGAGLIILGDVSIQPSMTPVPFLFSDAFVPGLADLVQAVHPEGAKIGAQLFHQEYDATEIDRLVKTDGQAAAMKQLHIDMQGYCNRITVDEISSIQQRFVDAAKRAEAAGFDMIQFNGDRLIGMFCSPIMNTRTDDYGGSLLNRARFAIEVVQKVKEAVPDLALDYKLVIIRTDPPMGKGGPTLDEAKTIAPWLVDAGVEGFHVALANHDALSGIIPAMGTQPYGCFVDLAEGVKEAVDVPVTAVGRLLFPDNAERVVKEGKADLIGLCRPLLADPEWPNKVRDGREEEIRYCAMCNNCVDCLTVRRAPVRCVLNASLGAEAPVEITKAADPKRVVVIGGGPAGMEAARVAALRGHGVTLFERANALGGQLRIASAAPHKVELARAADFLVSQMDKLRIDVRLNTEAEVEDITEIKPDEVIVATGSRPSRPPISGIDRPHVVDAWDVLAGLAPAGPRVVVIGGGAVGIETAEVLAVAGKKVTVVEMLEQVGSDISRTILPGVLVTLQEHGVVILSQHKLKKIRDNEVVLEEPSGDEIVVAAETVVLAVGTTPENSIVGPLRDAGISTTLVGDCGGEAPGSIEKATRDGFAAALAIGDADQPAPV